MRSFVAVRYEELHYYEELYIPVVIWTYIRCLRVRPATEQCNRHCVLSVPHASRPDTKTKARNIIDKLERERTSCRMQLSKRQGLTGDVKKKTRAP